MGLDNFNSDELKMLSDYDYLIKVKNIVNKLQKNLSILREDKKKVWNEHLSGIYPGTGKISRGSNYRSLPYLILDFPNLFSKQEILACRTMIWWGKEISCSLHLEGNILEKYRQQLHNNISAFIASGFYLCINNSPWEYHFERENYLPINEMKQSDLNKMISTKSFIKISRRLDINQINKLEQFTLETFSLYLMALSSE